MLKGPFLNVYFLLYAVFLWLSVYFTEHVQEYTFTLLGETLPIGILFLTMVSTFRDLAQLSGLRLKSIGALVLVCVFVLLDIDETNIAVAVVAALFWTEIVDFALFTAIAARWNYSRNAVLSGIVVSDIVAIPLLWFLIVIFFDLPLSVYPYDFVRVQFVILGIFYAVSYVFLYYTGLWKDFSIREKARE